MWLSFPRELTLKEDEKKQIEEWSKKHDSECPILQKAEQEVNEKGLVHILELPNLPFGPIGGSRTFSLTSTSIGTIITVECPCGEEFVVDNNL